MCRLSQDCNTLWTVAFSALASFLFLAFTLPANAEVVDIADQAAASRDKLESEIANVDSDLLRNRLLQSAANDRLAHWYAGEVLIEDNWLTLKEAQLQAADDKDFSAYYELREQAVDRLTDHEQLARWCEKHGLEEIAHVHWLHVLRFDQKHRAALSELGLIWHQGRLLTLDEAEQSRQREREWLKQKKSWQVKVKQLRRDLEKGPQKESIIARRELRAIHEPAAVPALLEEFAVPARDEERTIARQTELMAVLGGINTPVAVETLAQFAVESADDLVRYAALDQLKSKPLETYVPALLASMAMPVESSVSINNYGNRVVSSYSYSQEKPGGKEYKENRYASRAVPGNRYQAVQLYRRGRYVSPRTIKGRTSKVPITPGHGRGWVAREINGLCSNGNPYSITVREQRYGEEYLKEVKTPDRNIPGHYSAERAGVGYLEDPAFSKRQQAARGKLQQQAFQARQALDNHNQATQIQNERIASVLSEVTGETLSAFPKSWWNWWGEYLDRHPDIANVGTRRQLNMALLNQQQRGLARGTWVWTRLGKQPVETVLPGDFVLAQDPRTGELAYQVVLAIARPQQIAVSKVDFEESELYCAPGHVVWASGSGWQHMSTLKTGQSLHGVTTEAHISQIDEAFDIDGYDLIVDRFHTFFVGEQGLLVHDATPIAPTHVALPGFSPAAVAEAAHWAANSQ